MNFKSLFLIILFAPCFIFAQPQTEDEKPDLIVEAPKSPTAKGFFLEGVKQYSQKEYKKAQNMFHSSHTLEPSNPYILYNLGLSSFHLKEWGLTIGAWRKALYLKPNLKSSLSLLSSVEAQLKNNSVIKPNLWTLFLNRWMNFLYWELLLGGLLLTLIVFFYYFLKYLGKRKQAYYNDSPMPKFSWLSFNLFLLMIGLSFLTTSKTLHHYTSQAIVIIEAQAKSSPVDSSSTIFEVHEGQTLVVNKAENNWLQIETISGTKGWLLKDQLFHISGQKIW